MPSSLQIVGCTQLSRRQTASTSGRVHFISYMLAVGPPISLTTPVKSGWVVAHFFDFGQHRFLAAALDDAPFVGRDAAKRATAEAAAHDLHRVLDDIVRRNFFAAVAGVRQPRVGQAVDAIHFGLRERQRAGIDDNGFRAVELDKALGVVRIGFLMGDFGKGAEGAFRFGVVAGDFFEGGKRNGGPFSPR